MSSRRPQSPHAETRGDERARRRERTPGRPARGAREGGPRERRRRRRHRRSRARPKGVEGSRTNAARRGAIVAFLLASGRAPRRFEIREIRSRFRNNFPQTVCPCQSHRPGAHAPLASVSECRSVCRPEKNLHLIANEPSALGSTEAFVRFDPLNDGGSPRDPGARLVARFFVLAVRPPAPTRARGRRGISPRADRYDGDGVLGASRGFSRSRAPRRRGRRGWMLFWSRYRARSRVPTRFRSRAPRALLRPSLTLPPPPPPPFPGPRPRSRDVRIDTRPRGRTRRAGSTPSTSATRTRAAFPASAVLPARPRARRGWFAGLASRLTGAADAAALEDPARLRGGMFGTRGAVGGAAASFHLRARARGRGDARGARGVARSRPRRRRRGGARARRPPRGGNPRPAQRDPRRQPERGR